VVKKAFALRIDAQMLLALQQWADTEFRSVNGQIEYILHDALRRAGRLSSVADMSMSAAIEPAPADLAGAAVEAPCPTAPRDD